MTAQSFLFLLHQFAKVDIYKYIYINAYILKSISSFSFNQ